MNTVARTLRERIQQKPLLHSAAHTDAARTSPTDTTTALSALRRILAGPNSGAAFQSVVIATVRIVERAMCQEHCVAQAALSLGQQEKLSGMVDTIEEAALLLRDQLSTQGSSLTNLCGEQPARSGEAAPWPDALFSAVQVLVARHRIPLNRVPVIFFIQPSDSRRYPISSKSGPLMVSLSNAQPKGSSSRALSDCTAQLLRSHHNTLLLEAEEWMA